MVPTHDDLVQNGRHLALTTPLAGGKSRPLYEFKAWTCTDYD